MNVSVLWLCCTVAAILGMVAYDVAIKLATEHVNAYLFTSILVAVALIGHLAVLLAVQYYYKDISIDMSFSMLWLAVLGGLGLVVMDVFFFLGVRYGGLAATNALWFVGGLLVTVLIGVYFFHEQMSWSNMLGVLFGAVSVFLMVL